MSLTPDVTPVVKNYGTYETFMQHSPETEEHLQRFFPNTFREICTLSLIRLVDGVPAKLVRPVFFGSSLSDISPDIATSEGSVRKFIAQLGKKQET